MRTFVVHPADPSADASSITQALGMAHGGDIVLIESGTYGPEHTGEQLPLRVPAGVMVEGQLAEACIIDGGGLFEPSFNPIRPDRSVLVLEDATSLAGVTVQNGGGHGIGVPPGATTTIRNCTISQHGDHGVYLCGVASVLISRCDFRRNGLKRFEPTLPRGTGARQGHHIFAEARHGQPNQLVITDNTMQECFADGIAAICFFPESDGVAFSALILRNTIESSERGGLLFSSSFGPSYNHLQLVAADNVLSGNRQFGIHILTSIPLADKVPQHNRLTGLIAGNTIADSPIGIAVQAAVSEAHSNACRLTIDHNQIAECKKNAVRLVGATGMDGLATRDNTLDVALTRNAIAGSVAIQGAGGPAGSTLHNNAATVRLSSNTGDGAQGQNIRVSNGRQGNQASVAEGGQAYQRTDQDLL